MSKIRIMNENLANRIAAGEVIERPASVVKELVENAIDAGASRICVVIEHAGTRMIRVSDDGCGMDADDVLLAIEPHGTSKLLELDDIDHISTLGFRGEALPSIAEISRFTLFSRPREALEGTRLRVEGGRVISAEPAGGAVGTCVEVRDLFFNTPARRKFLKSPATEEHHIEEMLIGLAIGHPEVGFQLRFGSRVVFDSAAGAAPEYRLRELFGRAFMDNLRPVSHREGEWTVTGFVAAPGFTRIGRREQRVFVNSRPIESPAIYRGIRDGYGVLAAESGRFPPTALFFTLPPSEVDVNVHPAKREVRFRSEFAVTRFITAAVAAALRGDGAAEVAEPVECGSDGGKGFSPAPPSRENPAFAALSGKVPLSLVIGDAEVVYEPKQGEEVEFSDLVAPSPEPEATTPGAQAAAEVPALFLTDLTDRNDGAAASERLPGTDGRNAPPPEFAVFAGEWPEEVLGIYDAVYILASGRDGLVLIDQHAAHERIMFERLCDEAAAGSAVSQPLLMPQLLELSRPRHTLLLRHRRVFERLGFDFEPVGGSSVMLNALPAHLASGADPERLVADMLDELLDGSSSGMPVEPEYVARAACHAAVKAHDELSVAEARELLRQLRLCRQGTLCPHGRPTMITLSRKELEKRFGRR